MNRRLLMVSGAAVVGLGAVGAYFLSRPNSTPQQATVAPSKPTKPMLVFVGHEL
jgi:hypothetical protein